MFSGIVECQTAIVRVVSRDQTVGLILTRPFEFDDIGEGDSICVNGVCLTVEKVSDEEMEFTVGPETLRVTTLGDQKQRPEVVNVERSLKLGSRIHGHIVTGHADGVAVVEKQLAVGESIELWIEVGQSFLKYIWVKGSIAINGVSLTINKVEGALIQVCLIPETLRRTNLSKVTVGDKVNIEVDSMARAFLSSRNFGAKELNFE